MAKATVTYRELRFVIGTGLTHVYVLCEAGGDCPLGVQGWHYKAFPAQVTAEQILQTMFTTDDCLLWPQHAPESRLEPYRDIHE